MRRNAKVKALATRLPIRRAAMTATVAARRSFPAWIDAGDGAAFSATSVTPRVRDGLVLRTVAKKKPTSARNPSDASGAR